MSGAEPVPTSPTAQSRAAVLAALSDVVTVTDPNNTDAAPQPLRPAPAPNAKGGESGGGFGSRVAGAFGKLRGNKKGGRAQDGAGSKSGGAAADKGPSRIDVIDRLDASGLHGLSLFHHDSPYDACSPHSNRHGARAPVKAFTFEEGGAPGQPGAARPRGQGQGGGSNGSGGSRQNLSPLAQATLQRMNAADADMYAGGAPGAGSGSTAVASGVSPNIRAKPPVHRSRTMDSYNSASTPSSDGPADKPGIGRAQSASSDFSTNGPPTLPYDEAQYGAGRPVGHERSASSSSAVSGAGARNNGYMTAASAYPTHERSDESHPLAEVWGIVPEPWQEFATPAAPTGRSRNGKSGGSHLRAGNGANGGLSPYGEGHESGTPSAASSVLDMEAVMTGKTSSSKDNNGTSSSALGNSDGTVRRAGGRYGSGGGMNRSLSGGKAGVGSNAAAASALDNGLDADTSGDYVIEAGVSPFPEPDYGGPPRRDPEDIAAYGAYGSGAAGPKRSKSLIKRMKSARQNPNMPALKLDTSNVELGSYKKGSPSSSSPMAGTPTGESRRLRHLSSPVMPSPGAARASPLAPQYEEGASAGMGSGDAYASGEGADYLDAHRGRPPHSGADSLSPPLGLGGGKGSLAARSYSPGSGGGSPGGSGLGRSGSLFSKFGRNKARA
ncbi:hypothetical protein OC844_005609 [Tilletia horrida]|nr:hypothetical protein OC844_005609 [Tilletia horrida]